MSGHRDVLGAASYQGDPSGGAVTAQPDLVAWLAAGGAPNAACNPGWLPPGDKGTTVYVGPTGFAVNHGRIGGPPQ